MAITVNCRKCRIEFVPSFTWYKRDKKYRPRKICKPCEVGQIREWRQRTGYCKIYYRKNQEKLLAAANKRRRENLEHIHGIERAYKERTRHKYRVTRLGLNYQRFAAKWEGAKGICYICGLHVPLNLASPDHVIPTSAGGKNEMDNIMPVHRGCNAAKRNHSVEEVLSWRFQSAMP